MSINLATQYPGRVTAPDANYTYGSAKNETAPGAGDGTPYELARANDIIGFQQALLRSAGIVPNGNADTQLVSEYMQAIVELASGRAVNYDESGIADTYVADVRANQQGPRSYFDGLVVEFTPGNDNTGASTINVNGLGVKNIFRNGAALVAGELLTTQKSKIVFNVANDRFNLDAITAQVIPNYRGGNIVYTFNDGLANASFFPASTIAQNAWESVGKTGSGASNIWTAMNVLPANVTALIVSVELRITDDIPSAQYSVNLHSRITGSVAGTADSLLSTYGVVHSTTIAAETTYIRSDVIVPINQAGLFDARWLGTGGAFFATSIDMELRGFIL